MRPAGIIAHIAFSAAAAAALTVLPAVLCLGGADKSVDAVASASVKLPDKPSGEFEVLINRRLHKDTLEQWVKFFRDGELDVIFDDLNCICAEGDVQGIQLAQRFQAELPENQLRLRTENPTLLISKAENSCIDVVIISKDMADAVRLASQEKLKDTELIFIREDTQNEKD